MTEESENTHDFTPLRMPLFFALAGLFLLIVGWRIFVFQEPATVEFVSESPESTLIKVDISGAVVSPDVYELPSGARIGDLLDRAGGLSEEADKEWIARSVNLAGKLVDGTKLYIRPMGEVINTAGAGNVLSLVSGTEAININTASKTELESLPGIGPVTAEKIISGRPYETIDELVSKKAIGAKTLEKIREKIRVY